jgi:uncharacterized protein (DUF2126 family)
MSLPALPDANAARHNMLRVVDEDKSEPDGYLYPLPVFKRRTRLAQSW